MRIFFDCEFTGLHKDTTLISIGLVSENGFEFYAEITDYDNAQVDDWIKSNVIDNLVIDDLGDFILDMYDVVTDKNSKFISFSMKVKGTREKVKVELNKWLDQFNSIEWVSDVCHYDFVLLIDLVYGHALKIPYGIHCSACHDINQDIARYLSISEISAFDYSREDIIKSHHRSVSGVKHNSLYDAKVIKELYEITNN